MLATVKIEQDKENKHIHRVFVDGKEIKRVRSVGFEVSVDSPPNVNIEIVGGCDFEGMADVHFDYSPRTTKEACRIIREELLKREELYNGFIASIESSLKEQKVTGLPFQPESEIAEKILNRIIGEESHERED